MMGNDQAMSYKKTVISKAIHVVHL